jgi:hypothetical protein
MEIISTLLILSILIGSAPMLAEMGFDLLTMKENGNVPNTHKTN